MIKNISNLGDAALYCDFGKDVNKDINTQVIKYFKTIQKKNIVGVNNITPSYNKLIISFDLKKINFKKLKKIIDNIEIIKSDSIQNKKFEIPICCEKEFSLDIKRLEEKLKMKEEKIYESFFKKEFFCYMTGFIAGMPFLGDIDKNLHAKRLETPRVKVPKGSIGLTEQFCNIYTFESPGGWNIIGNSPKKVFTKDPTKLTLIDPGDEVEFFEISKKEYSKLNEQK